MARPPRQTSTTAVAIAATAATANAADVNPHPNNPHRHRPPSPALLFQLIPFCGNDSATRSNTERAVYSALRTLSPSSLMNATDSEGNSLLIVAAQHKVIG